MHILWLAAKAAYMQTDKCLKVVFVPRDSMLLHGQAHRSSKPLAHTCVIPTARPAAPTLVALLPPNSPIGCATNNTPTTHRGTHIQINLQLSRAKLPALHDVSKRSSKPNKSLLQANTWLHSGLTVYLEQSPDFSQFWKLAHAPAGHLVKQQGSCKSNHDGRQKL